MKPTFEERLTQLPADWQGDFSSGQYKIGKACYAKNQVSIQVNNFGTFKSRAACLLSFGLKARFSGREHAYICSVSKAELFVELFTQGWDATLMGRLVPPPKL